MQWPNDYVFYRVPKRHYPVVDRGEGIYIWDDTGKRYIDGSGGAAVVTIGHGVGEIMEAMVRQARRIAYTHGTHFTSEAAKECAERLCRLVPDQRLNRVYFLSGGSEAVEAAVKVARQYWEEIGERDRYKIISRWGDHLLLAPPYIITEEQIDEMVVATATLKCKHSSTNIAVAFETPLRLCPLTRTFQGNLRGYHRIPLPNSI